MNILEQIVAHKKKEVERRISEIPISKLEKSAFFSSPVISLKKSLLDETNVGLIAEFKRKSPSKGMINSNTDVAQTTLGYANAGASALSILTDSEYFGGSTDDILSARKENKIPILRKEFIIDEYQIIEAKSIGADVILLLANILSPNEIKQFSTTAKWLGLEILLEVREKSELNSVNVLIDCIGVNNRNLRDFKVDIKQSLELSHEIPKGFLKISESGIDSAKTIHELKQVGYNGFLIGETFMRETNPAATCAKLIKEIREYK